MSLSSVIMKKRTPMAVLCLCIALAVLVMPVTAVATTQVTITKMSENGSTVVNETTVSWEWMMNNLPVLGNGTTMYYTQGPVFESAWDEVHPNETYDPWNPTEDVNLIYKDHGQFMGTDVKDLCNLVGGADNEGMVEIKASDGMYKRWPGEYVNNPTSRQGPMGLIWYHGDDEGYVNQSFEKGLRLYFFGETVNADGWHVWGNWDMHESWDEKYWYYYSGQWPSASGNSVYHVNRIKIFPSHTYDFATGGDTVEYAYEGGVGASPGLNDPSSTTVDTSKIAADDGNYDWFNTTTTGDYAAQRFVFNVTESASNIEKLAVTWDGTSSHDNSGADQGATTYIWKSGTGYESISGDITSNIGDYVVNGNVTVLVKQNSAHSDLDEASRLSTDYVKLVVTHHHTN